MKAEEIKELFDKHCSLEDKEIRIGKLIITKAHQKYGELFLLAETSTRRRRYVLYQNIYSNIKTLSSALK